MEKYLRHYAEAETAALDGLPDREPWANVLVIPACNESPGFLRPPPPCGGRSLMILVINESESARHQVSSNNQALAATVQARFEKQWQSGPGIGLQLLRDPLAPRDVLLVDRFSAGSKLPARGGVGHARKIGADLAAKLIHTQCIRSPWIHCSDADVQLPKTYFTCIHDLCKPNNITGPHVAALIYPFHHCDDEDNEVEKGVILATQLYELSLRYYRAGMQFAQSPYAFHTIGSTMAVNAIHYAKVRGFPKREAGEDFYLLNKLAKVGSVLELDRGPDCEAIEIEARRSDRVPFGTGAAVNKITSLADPVDDFRFYHPAVFELLQIWLQSLPAIWLSRSRDLALSVLPAPQGDHERYGQEQPLLAALKKSRVSDALDHAFRQSKDLNQFTQQMNIWFDAFRTLKLIHTLRDLHLPSISYTELAANKTFVQLLAQDPELSDFHEQLRQKFS